MPGDKDHASWIKSQDASSMVLFVYKVEVKAVVPEAAAVAVVVGGGA